MRMASFRRSLSPMATADRSISTPFAYNGDTDGAAASSHKYSSPSSSPSSSAMNSPFSSSATSVSASLLATTAHMRTLLFSNYPQKPGRAGEKSRPRLLQQQQIWKRPVAQFLLCFLIGFLLGFTPFCSDTFSPNLELKQQQQQQQQQQQPSVLEMNSATSNTVDTEPVKILKKNTVEYSNVLDHSSMALKIYDFVPQKLLIVVTPTYNRPFQALYLNRVAHTLKLVQPPLLWIVVEMNDQSMETAELLRRSGVMYRHLVYEKNSTDTKDRGTHQRNIALAHIEHHRLDGIVYFADDDNVYTLELFQQMRKIRRFGTWPVGMLAQSKNKAILEGPVCDRGQVIGWHTNEKSKRLRRFHVDMSGFAFNSTILWEPQRWGRRTTQPIRQLDTIKEGFQETTFIEQLVEDEYQMQGVPENCSKIMVWHLHLEAPGLAYPPGWIINKNLDVVVPVERSMVRIF